MAKKLYELLDVKETATQAEIKKAFRQRALHLHPDKNKDENATESFQKLQEAFEVLSNPERRKLYDEKGLSDEDDLSFEKACQYYRMNIPPVTEEDIANIAREYKESEEEKCDLVDLYTKNKGDISSLLEEILLSRTDEIERFLSIYER
eukprot:Platyproteum_vivax@DN5864_c0_g1_i1.p1